MYSKKAISPVVATTLLLVVAVVAVVNFQTWFSIFSTSIFSDIEEQDLASLSTQIESVISGSLYFKNTGVENITINSIKLNGVDCDISGEYQSGVSDIDLSLCMQNVDIGEAEVVVYTDTKIYSEKFNLNSIPGVCSLNGTLGTGSLLNPFGICDCIDLQDIQNNLSGNYRLYSDIDCSDTINWNSGAGFLPIGTYTGTFDGYNHTISNLYIRRLTTDNVGLFSIISSGTAKNVFFQNSNVSGEDYVGTLASDVRNSTILNIHITNGFVNSSSTQYRGTGGVIGTLSNSASTLSSLSYTGIVRTNGSEAGGVLGSCYSIGSYLDKSYANVYIYGTGNTGIVNSIRIGGLVGEIYNNCTINTSYAITNLNSTYSVLAGLVGGAHNGSIYNSYSFANISCNNNVCVNQIGGILGWCQSSCSGAFNTYFVGNITGYNGYNGSAINPDTRAYNSFYDLNLSQVSVAGGGTGKTTVQMQNTTIFTNAGWDTNVWTLVNGSYPRLYWE